MNEEKMELVEVNETEVVDTYEEPEKSGGALGKLVIGAGLVAAGVGAYLYKTKEKRKAKRISKLIEEGYVVYKPEETVDSEEDFEEEFEEESNETEK